MDFSNILNDLKKLEGIRLNSIRPGAEITITEVDHVQKKVLVRSSCGKIQSRSFSEFQRIWEALLASPAIRVEEVLNGSGSSRNQPETIFANLPYIQWLKLDNKKHIAYVGKPTHAFGTLQQMDGMHVAELVKAGKTSLETRETLVVVSTNNVARAGKIIETLAGRAISVTQEGHYVYNYNSWMIVLADAEKHDIPCGTYIEISHIPFECAKNKLKINGECWDIIRVHHLNAVVKQYNE